MLDRCKNKEQGQPCSVTGRMYCNPHFENSGRCGIDEPSDEIDPFQQLQQTEMDFGELPQTPPFFPSIIQRGM
jgi:hypothetical protein